MFLIHYLCNTETIQYSIHPMKEVQYRYIFKRIWWVWGLTVFKNWKAVSSKLQNLNWWTNYGGNFASQCWMCQKIWHWLMKNEWRAFPIWCGGRGGKLQNEKWSRIWKLWISFINWRSQWGIAQWSHLRFKGIKMF